MKTVIFATLFSLFGTLTAYTAPFPPPPADTGPSDGQLTWDFDDYTLRNSSNTLTLVLIKNWKMVIYHFPNNTALLVTSNSYQPLRLPGVDSFVSFELFQADGQPVETVEDVFRFANDCHAGDTLQRKWLSRPDLFNKITRVSARFGGHYGGDC